MICAHCAKQFTDGDSLMFCSEECGDLFDADLAAVLNDESEEEWW